MTTAEAIRFRYLAAQLTHVETRNFITQLFNTDVNTIITGLFHYINLSTSNENDSHKITNLISNIILLRKKKAKTISSQNMKFNEFPKCLIGSVASFLKQNDYINLSKCCRSIFISCNIPNKLQQLNLLYIEDYSMINVQQFPFIKHLAIQFNDFHELTPYNNDRSVCNNVESIRFDMTQSPILLAVKAFSNDNLINTQNVTKLTWNGLYSVDFEVSGFSFPKLLSRFPKIQFLNLSGIQCYQEQVEQIKEECPNVVGLGISGHLEFPLIAVYAHQLECLLLKVEHGIFYRFFNDFPKLRELGIINPSFESINDILTIAPNLKKVSLAPDMFCMGSDLEGICLETKNIISKAIASCKKLECIEIYDINIWSPHRSIANISVLEGIENGILFIQEIHRNEVKLRVCMHNPVADDIGGYIAKVERIIKLLEQSNIKDYVFIWSFFTFPKNMDKDDLFRKLRDISPGGDVQKGFNVSFNGGTDVEYYITNAECKINYYHISWSGDCANLTTYFQNEC